MDIFSTNCLKILIYFKINIKYKNDIGIFSTNCLKILIYFKIKKNDVPMSYIIWLVDGIDTKLNSIVS